MNTSLYARRPLPCGRRSLTPIPNRPYRGRVAGSCIRVPEAGLTVLFAHHGGPGRSSTDHTVIASAGTQRIGRNQGRRRACEPPASMTPPSPSVAPIAPSTVVPAHAWTQCNPRKPELVTSRFVNATLCTADSQHPSSTSHQSEPFGSGGSGSDRRPQGSGRRAYREVFTARRTRTHPARRAGDRHPLCPVASTNTGRSPSAQSNDRTAAARRGAVPNPTQNKESD